MDLATLIGCILAWGAVLFSMYDMTEGHMGAYFKPPELFLVFGGALGAAMLSMPLHNITGIVNYIKSGKATHIITMAGAGISTSAGIPAFRSPGSGLYHNLEKYDLPSP